MAEELAIQQRGVAVAVLDRVRTRIAAAGQARPDSVFEIGAVTWTFTALTLARLVEAGAVGWDEPVRDLLGTAVPSRDGVEMTLGHLAMHCSGLPRHPRGVLWGGVLRGHRSDPFADCTPSTMIEGLRRTRLRFTPGSGHSVSHLGVALLGLALERRTLTPFSDLLAREVCAPLGLLHTGTRAPGLVQGHDERGRPATPWHPAGMAPAVGLRSSAHDLALLLRAHLEPDSSPLGPAILFARRRELPIGDKSWTHPGWFRRDVTSPAGFSHWGATGGFTCVISYVPARHTAVAVLSASRVAGDDTAPGFLHLLGRGP